MQPEQYIEIPEALLQAAFEEIVSWAPRADSRIDVPPSLLREVIAYLSEDLGCDHAVNICTCSTQQTVYELKLALEGRKVCPMCGGEGMVWDNNQPVDDVGEQYAKCPTCWSNGTVPMSVQMSLQNWHQQL